MFRTGTTRFLLPLAAVLALIACKPQEAPDTAADKAALQTAAEGWEKAYNDKNADAVAAVYTDDGQLLPPGAAAVNGNSAIRDYWANDVSTQWAKLTIKADSSDLAGDWAWRAGTWSAETSPAVTGKYVEIWRRTPSGWKLHRDIWNVDAPAPPAEPPAAPAAPAAQ